MFIYFIIAALIVLLDQVSKYYLALQLAGGEPAELIPGLVRMIYIENTGAAFSFLSDMRWILVGISTVVIVLIVFGMLRYKDKINWVGRLGLAAILGGAFSNLIDRAVFGYVADFFEFEFVTFAIFNVADIFITVGAVVFCLWYLFQGSKQDGLRDEFIIGGKKKKAADIETGGNDASTDAADAADATGETDAGDTEDSGGDDRD